jgi:cytochrome c
LIRVKAVIGHAGQMPRQRGDAMRRLLSTLALLSIGGGLAVPAWGATPVAGAPSDAASRGLYVALRVCAACHAVGPLGTGPDTLAPAFATIRLHHDAPTLRRRLQEISTVGHHEMPAIVMTAQEQEDVAAYIEAAAAPAAEAVRR